MVFGPVNIFLIFTSKICCFFSSFESTLTSLLLTVLVDICEMLAPSKSVQRYDYMFFLRFWSTEMMVIKRRRNLFFYLFFVLSLYFLSLWRVVCSAHREHFIFWTISLWDTPFIWWVTIWPHSTPFLGILFFSNCICNVF